MKKLNVFIFLLVFTSLFLAAVENGAGEWKLNAASTTYGVALLPVQFEGADNGSSNMIFMPGIDIRLFNGTNITERGGFYTGIEIGAVMFISTDAQFQDSYDGPTAGSVTYDIVNSGSFLGTVFLLGKYGYRLDLGVKIFGISLGWELGIGARIASGNFDYNANIAGFNPSISHGYDTTAMSMILDTAVEAAIRLGTNLRFVARLGAMLTPPLVKIDSSTTAPLDVTTVTSADADDILGSYDIESFPIIPTVRLGFIVSY